MSTPSIRPEITADQAAVRDIVTAAFAQPLEADLVDALRASGNAIISLVAEVDGAVVGHILFSPVTIAGAPSRVLGLAPVSVSPAVQRSGIGGALIRTGLAQAAALDYTAIVLLGHATYYPRFGFVPASHFGLRCEYNSPDENFMALELQPNGLANTPGLVQYGPEFAAF